MNTKKLIVFLLWAFVPMVIVGLVMHFSGASTTGLPKEPSAIDPLAAVKSLLFSAGAMLIPLLAVIFTQLIFKDPVLKGLGISFKINAHTQRAHVKLATTPLSVEIAPGRLSAIETGDRRFEGFGPDAALPEGFYEVFGTGTERIYKLVRKELSSSLTDVNGDPIGYNDPNYRENVFQYFSFRTFYYFRDAEGQIKRIKSIGALIRQFPERKRELRRAVNKAGYGRKRFDDACRLILNLTRR